MLKDYRELVNLFENTHLCRKVCIRQALRGKGIYDRQYPILNYIFRNDGCTQVEIARALYISPASVALSTKRLQKAGLIQKKVDADSLRKNRISMTPMGYEIMQGCRLAVQQVDNNMFAEFKTEELSQLKALLDRMLVNLAGEEGRNLTPLARTAFINKMNQEEKKDMEEDDK
ncbi:MAG: hypothetical protein DBY39_07100 [Clostridiales bacterium]|nr:MAG: hypothetical protein DBY39_07100 [Clostridiales bacterium]